MLWFNSEETSLKFENLSDSSLEISGYNLKFSDHPSNTKYGGVWIYCLDLLYNFDEQEKY